MEYMHAHYTYTPNLTWTFLFFSVGNETEEGGLLGIVFRISKSEF